MTRARLVTYTLTQAAYRVADLGLAKDQLANMHLKKRRTLGAYAPRAVPRWSGVRVCDIFTDHVRWHTPAI